MITLIRMRRGSIALLALSAAGCGSGHRIISEPESRPPRALGATTMTVRVDGDADITDFVADVAPSYEGGECRRMVARSGTGSVVELSFPDRADPVHRVRLRYDSAENLASYADVRGNLHAKVVGPDGGPPQPGDPVRVVGPEGRRTSIHINLLLGQGIASNDGGDEPAETVVGDAEAMLHADNLGTPSRVIDTVENRCGSSRRR